MRRIINFFNSIWQKIKPSRRTKAIIITGLQVIGVMASCLVIGVALDALFLGSLGGVCTFAMLAYGIYYCSSNVKKFYQENSSYANRENTHHHSQDEVRSAEPPAQLNQCLLNDLEENTEQCNEFFTQKEIKFLNNCINFPNKSTSTKFMSSEINQHHLDFINKELTCPISQEIMNNPVTVYLKKKNEAEITVTYERSSLLKWLRISSDMPKREPTLGEHYMNYEKINFANNFPTKKIKDIKLQSKVSLIRKSIANFWEQLNGNLPQTRSDSCLYYGVKKNKKLRIIPESPTQVSLRP